MSVTAYADNDLIEKVYHQLAKIYDVAFGAILHSGRERAIRTISTDRKLRRARDRHRHGAHGAGISR